MSEEEASKAFRDSWGEHCRDAMRKRSGLLDSFIYAHLQATGDDIRDLMLVEVRGEDKISWRIERKEED